MQRKACCKINVGLDVLRRRQDGFHDLDTVMVPVRELYDVVDVELSKGEDVEFVSRGLVVDCPPQKNLCVKAYRLMQEQFSVPAVRITLDKRVPFGAGLGGGSSDATAVICLINDLFSLGLDKPRLAQLAALIGSDTAFFVYDRPMLCQGRGEVMQPIDLPLEGKQLVLLKPDEGVSTAEAYSGVHPVVPPVPLAQRVERPVGMWRAEVKNDFEKHIFESHPVIAQLKQLLEECGAEYAAMSGSGSAVYGIFASNAKVDEILKNRIPQGIFIHTEIL